MKAYISREGIGIKTKEDIFYTYHAYVTKEKKNDITLAIERIKNQYFQTEKYTLDCICVFLIVLLTCMLMEMIFGSSILYFVQTFAISIPVTFIILSFFNFKKSDKSRLGAVNCFNNAYKSTKGAITLNEIKKYSYYKKKDSVAIVLWICISIFILDILSYILITTNSPLNIWILVFTLFVIISILMIAFTNLSFIQRIYTKKPSYKDLSIIVYVANRVKEEVNN